MIKQITDFEYLPTTAELLYSHISSYSDMQTMVEQLMIGHKMSDPDMISLLESYVRTHFRLGKLKNGNYVTVISVEGDCAKICSELSQSSYQSLLNVIANEVIINSVAEIQLRQFECKEGDFKWM